MAETEGREDESFRAALLFAFDHQTALVVHGWVSVSPSDRSLYTRYAWNELEGDVYDLTQHDRPISRELFYRKWNVLERGIRKYTVQEAACMAVGTCSYGPWDKELFNAERLARAEAVERFGGRTADPRGD